MNATKKLNPFANPLDIRKLLANPPPVLKHVLPGLLEGTVGAVVAPGGVGKTMLLLQLGMAVATAHQLCGGLFADAPKNCAMDTTPGKVVFVAAEESADLLSHRLHAVSSYMLTEVTPKPNMFEKTDFLENLIGNFGVHALLGQPRALLIDDEYEPSPEFEQLVAACKGARLVLIDPLRQFHRGDENDSWNMTAVVQTLQTLAARTGAAVIVAHHTNRASTNTGTGDSAGAARGSTALTDGVRWQLNLSTPGSSIAAQYGIDSDERNRYVQVDIAKANYLAPQHSQLLERRAGGALALRLRPESEKSQKLKLPVAKAKQLAASRRGVAK